MTCPNFGGLVKGDICEYCGTVFTDIQKKTCLNKKFLNNTYF